MYEVIVQQSCFCSGRELGPVTRDDLPVLRYHANS